MIYPRFLKKGDKVAVTAPSAGIVDPIKINTFKNAKKELKNHYDLDVFFSENVFRDDGTGRSSSGFERGYQFNELVSLKFPWIIGATGGDFLVEMLDYVDYANFAENPCWVQGYSDLTSLLYSITTICDVATIYGTNFSIFGMEEYGQPHFDNIKLLFGETKEFHNYEKYEDGFQEKVTGLEYFNMTEKTVWKNAHNENKVTFSGRLLGGCTEIIFALIGTPYERTKEFCEKYKNDGIIFYFETFASNDNDMYLHLWQMKKAGFFKYCKGIMFGRPLFYNSMRNESYQDVCLSALDSLNIPIIFDVDIGHKAPQLPIVNGAYATVHSEDGNGYIKYEFLK